MNHRVFGTSGASLCEQKKDGERTEEPQVESRVRDDVEDDSVECEVKVGGLEKSDEALVKALCDKSAEGKETRPEVMSQNTAEIPVSDPTSAVAQKTAEKTGKQGLLELLGAMKVDTTTKTKLKSLRKVTSEQESVGKLKRVVMEKTSNMFQQATASHR